MEAGLCQKNKCSVFNVHPPKITFKFKVRGTKLEHREFQITNITDEPQAVSVFQTLTDHFHVVPRLAKGYLLPTETIIVDVTLKKRLEPKIHRDFVKVLCPKKCSFDVALEVVPKVRPLKSLPRVVNFGHVPLGHEKIQKVILRPFEKDTPYILMTKDHHADLAISPTRGAVHSEGKPVEIAIRYKPTAFVTLNAQVSLHLPSIIFKPYIFTVTAHTKPGFTRTEMLKQPQEAFVINPLKEKVNSHPTWLLKPTKKIQPRKDQPLWSQHKTNKCLLKQLKAKRSPNELLGPLGRYLDEEERLAIAKEKSFFEAVTLVHRSNFLAYSHTKTKLRTLEGPAEDQNQLWESYLKLYDTPTNDNNGQALYIRQRTVKRLDMDTKMREFTNKLPNIWFPRYVTMSKFIEAARRIIRKNRLMKVLQKLKRLTKESVLVFETPPVDLF